MDQRGATITDARGAKATFTYNPRHLVTNIAYDTTQGGELTQREHADTKMDIKCWHDFVPPRNLARCVRAALKYVDPEHLEGLDHVLLLERVPQISIRRDPDLRRTIEDGRVEVHFDRQDLAIKIVHHIEGAIATTIP